MLKYVKVNIINIFGTIPLGIVWTIKIKKRNWGSLIVFSKYSDVYIVDKEKC